MCDRRARTLGSILKTLEDVTLVRSSSPKVASRPPRQHGLCRIRTGSPGRPPRHSHSSGALTGGVYVPCVLNLLACPAVKSYRWQFGSSLPCSRDVFPAQIKSLCLLISFLLQAILNSHPVTEPISKFDIKSTARNLHENKIRAFQLSA